MSSYSHRLEIVQELGKLFPGKVLPLGFENRKLGYFAGIYLQTKWQKYSGRDSLPNWFLVNQSLTLDPFKYAQEYLKDPSSPSSGLSLLWKTYFKTGSLIDIWKAHTYSIRQTLYLHQAALLETKITPEESAFWQGWIRFILKGEKWSPPLNDLALKLPLQLTMPSSILTHPSKNFFIQIVSKNPLPQKDFLQKYGQKVE